MNNVDELIPLDTTPDPELAPGKPDVCAGHGHCCDECDHFLLCFPEFDSDPSEPDEFREIDAFLREQTAIELFGLALVSTYPAVLTDDYMDVLDAFEALMRQEYGSCAELERAWARNRIRGVRAFHMLTTDFPE